MTSRRYEGFKVLQFAVRNREYPRNSRIRDFLIERGAVVHVVEAGAGSRLSRYVRMLRAAQRRFRRGERPDIVILSEFSVEMALLSWLLSRRTRAKHVVDFFVGLYETEVSDSRRTKDRTFRALQLRIADRLAISLADYVVTDTEVRARTFTARYGAGRPISSLPVGAPSWARPAPAAQYEKSLPPQVLFYGTYLKLHGVDRIIAAIDWAIRNGDERFTVHLVGDGPERASVEELAAEVGRDGVLRFSGPVPASELACLLHRADVVLGVFGDSDKARTVIANKVWQGLYAGKVVVTQRSEALSEIKDLAGDALIEVDGRTAADLGAALLEGVRRARRVEFGSVAGMLEQHVSDRFEQFFDELFAESEASPGFKTRGP